MSKWDELFMEGLDGKYPSWYDTVIFGKLRQYHYKEDVEKWAAKIKVEGDNMAFNLKKRVGICDKLYENNRELASKLEAIQKIAKESNNMLYDPQYMMDRILEVLGDD